MVMCIRFLPLCMGGYTTAIGHGEMPLTIENNRGHEVGIETLHASLDAGCRHIDTAWAYYCSGGEEQTGEKLVREALETWKGPKDEVLVATKVGHFRNFTDGRPTWDVDGRPENLIRRGKESALALGVDTIDLLYFHRPDPKVPYNESVEAIKQLVDEGVAQEAGISNASIEQIDIARGILGDKLVAVQNQYSPISPGDPGHARLLRQGWLEPSCAGARSAATAPL
jgi:pyridoxine 4-dehydrogenase